MTPTKKTLSEQVVTIVVTAVVSAILALVLRAGVVEERQAEGAREITSLAASVDELKEGSPVVRTRLDAIEKHQEKMDEKLDDVWRVIVLKSSPLHRAEQ